jgi:D-sedoheptulose 7-phosphate isomerase
MSADADPRLALVARALAEGTELRARLARDEAARIVQIAELARACLAGGGKIVLFGNGGSAADAQHVAAELVGRFERERAPLAAIALTVDTSSLTAIGNDYGFEHVFARQLRALGRPGDLAVAISTSGRSPNVLEGARAARALGMKVVGLTGQGGEPLAALSDCAVVVPSRKTARIQEAHITVCHVVCEVLESMLAPAGALTPSTP